MLNSSKTCHYALRALLYLSRNRDRSYIKIEEIAKREAIPLNFLSKIFQMLRRSKFADSQLGPRGGVRLSSNSGRFTVADVILAVDGKIDLDSCALFGYEKCPELKSCAIQNECRVQNRKVWKKLKRMRLNKL